MIIILSIVILPLMHVFSVSVSSTVAVTRMQVTIFPKGFNVTAYKKIMDDLIFLRSLLNTIGITVVSTFLSIFIIIMIAYPLSKEYFFGKKIVTYFFVLTMYFSGGLIPSYLLVSKYLKLNNTYLAYILPSLVNVFYVIVVKSQLEALPKELLDAAVVDGASEFTVLLRIIIPVISPTIAAVSMFIALGRWNMWFPVLLYTNKNTMWTLQYYLRAIVFEKYLASTHDIITEVGTETIPPQNYQMAAIILVALPIVSIYPFVQKYFVKGILTGSVKS